MQSAVKSNLTAAALLVTGLLLAADEPKADDLTFYRTPATAVAGRFSLAGPGRAGTAGYLGVLVSPDARGRLAITDVPADSPGAKAGLQRGDIVTQLGGEPITRADNFRERLLTRSAGDAVKLHILRGDKPLEVTATLGAVSRPMRLGGQRAFFGAALGEAKDNEGTPVERVQPGSPAATAGLTTGDIILKINDLAMTRPAVLTDLLAEKKPGDTLAIVLQRGGKELELKVQLAEDRAGGGRFGGRESTPLPLWKKDAYRLAVVCIEFPDVKHNDKVATGDWEQALFSRNSYAQRENATGQPVHGSLNDYFQEQSCGAFRIEGKVFDWLPVSKKRGDYSQGSGTSNRSALLIEALEKLQARDGKEALKGFDGLFFLYAGDRVLTNRGALYFPHSGSFFQSDRRWSYMLAAEGGSKMTPTVGFCREFAFLLGLPDLAARTENAGSEGCGAWCMLSEPGASGAPRSLCAWAKEQLGWLKPTVLDPALQQKLLLAWVAGSAQECFKVIVRPDGSEYFLLENRRKGGGDAALPGEGLLIWRVVGNRPLLEESHGVEGATGPRVFVDLVPYPSSANSAFTPNTTPSSRSQRGGGLPVHITEIRKLPDGRIAFHIGYEYQ